MLAFANQHLHQTLLCPVVFLLVRLHPAAPLCMCKVKNIVRKTLMELQVLINIHLKGSLKGEVVI